MRSGRADGLPSQELGRKAAGIDPAVARVPPLGRRHVAALAVECPGPPLRAAGEPGAPQPPPELRPSLRFEGKPDGVRLWGLGFIEA